MGNAQFNFPIGPANVDLNKLKDCLNQNKGSQCIIDNISTPDGQRPTIVQQQQTQEDFEQAYEEFISMEQLNNRFVILVVAAIIILYLLRK
jgi:hypothetical protein